MATIPGSGPPSDNLDAPNYLPPVRSLLLHPPLRLRRRPLDFSILASRSPPPPSPHFQKECKGFPEGERGKSTLSRFLLVPRDDLPIPSLECCLLARLSVGWLLTQWDSLFSYSHSVNFFFLIFDPNHWFSSQVWKAMKVCLSKEISFDEVLSSNRFSSIHERFKVFLLDCGSNNEIYFLF